MADRSDKDELERQTTSPGMPKIGSSGMAALPVDEPGQRSIEEQRRDLLRVIEELDGALRYMGNGHPQRNATEKRLEHLRAMLAQVEAITR
jgi:hypothetical protein